MKLHFAINLFWRVNISYDVSDFLFFFYWKTRDFAEMLLNLRRVLDCITNSAMFSATHGFLPSLDFGQSRHLNCNSRMTHWVKSWFLYKKISCCLCHKLSTHRLLRGRFGKYWKKLHFHPFQEKVKREMKCVWNIVDSVNSDMKIHWPVRPGESLRHGWRASCF